MHLKAFRKSLFHPSLASPDGKEWKCSKFLRILQPCILQTRPDSLKPCIRYVMTATGLEPTTI